MLKDDGLVDGGEMISVIETAKKRAAGALGRIFEGETEICPTRLKTSKRTACGLCPYGDVCRFDPDLSRKGYRDIYPVKAKDFFGRGK